MTMQFRGLKLPDAKYHDTVRVTRSDGGVAIQCTDGRRATPRVTAFVSAQTARRIAAELAKLSDLIAAEARR